MTVYGRIRFGNAPTLNQLAVLETAASLPARLIAPKIGVVRLSPAPWSTTVIWPVHRGRIHARCALTVTLAVPPDDPGMSREPVTEAMPKASRRTVRLPLPDPPLV